MLTSSFVLAFLRYAVPNTSQEYAVDLQHDVRCGNEQWESRWSDSQHRLAGMWSFTSFTSRNINRPQLWGGPTTPTSQRNPSISSSVGMNDSMPSQEDTGYRGAPAETWGARSVSGNNWERTPAGNPVVSPQKNGFPQAIIFSHSRASYSLALTDKIRSPVRPICPTTNSAVATSRQPVALWRDSGAHAS